jgi:hypothetical protein
MLRFESLQKQVEDNAAEAAQKAAKAKATGRLLPASRSGGAPSASAMQQDLCNQPALALINTAAANTCMSTLVTRNLVATT